MPLWGEVPLIKERGGKVVTVIRGLIDSFDINIAVMEETRVNVADDANDHVDDVAVGEDFDSQTQVGRKPEAGNPTR